MSRSQAQTLARSRADWIQSTVLQGEPRHSSVHLFLLSDSCSMLMWSIMCLCGTAASLCAHSMGLRVQSSISKQWGIISNTLDKVMRTPRAQIGATEFHANHCSHIQKKTEKKICNDTKARRMQLNPRWNLEEGNTVAVKYEKGF